MPSFLTQNLWGAGPFWGHRLRSLVGLVRRVSPEILGLQEVHAGKAQGQASQAHDLAGRLEGYSAVFAPGRTAPSGRCEGVAIVARHPIVASSVTVLSRDRGDRFDRFGPRVVLGALIDSPEGLIDVFVTHLSLSRRARARTVPELVAFTATQRSRSASRGAILLGDLNAGPADPALATLAGQGWIDAWSAVHDPSARGETYPSFAPSRRIDYILAHPQNAWTVERCERMPRSGSDHRGVAAWLGLSGAEPS